MPSPFQTIAGAAEGGGEQATPVHHDNAPGGANIKGPLEAQIGDHDDALRNYMGRIVGGQTLHPDEYHDYESRMKEKAHDSGLLEKLNEQHRKLETRGKDDVRQHTEAETRSKGAELLNKFGGGQQ